MRKRFSLLGPLVFTIMTVPPLFASTFVVPADRDMIRRARAIVVASPTNSYTQITPLGGIETVTAFSVEEVIKGMPALVGTIEVHEPGGELDGRATVIAGVPQFEPGEPVILFLSRTPQQTWAVTDLVLGAFHLMSDRGGRHVAVRDEGDVVGWDTNGLPHLERRRSAELFLEFLRTEARGGMGVENYFVPTEPLIRLKRIAPLAISALAFTGSSYTSDASGGRGARWAAFPGGVNVFAGANGEPGAPGNGVTAVQTAINSWDNDCASNVNYVYTGTDSTHTTGLAGPDGANTVLFERNLSQYGVTPFMCSGNSYGGTLGIGGITSTSGTNVLSGETYFTTTEGDVEMNRGIANCTALFNNGDWNSALTHEVGHTLGFRHSDQTRANNPSVPCSGDPSLECSSSAIMRSSIPSGFNGALQPYDINAVRAVYPGGTCGGTCTAPAVTGQPASTTITSGQSATLSVTATGTAPLSYQWYVGNSGNTASPIGGATGSSITVSPTTTTSYWVRVSNACGSANSVTATVTVNAPPPPPPPPPVRTRGDFDGDGKADILWHNLTTGQNVIWLMNGPAIANGAFIQSTGAGWAIPGMGDLDGDGHNDLIPRNPATGEVMVWLMNGFSVVASASRGVVDLAFDLVTVQDFDGDGKDDLLFRNNSTGQNVMWLMNGLNLKAGAFISNATTNVRLAGSGDFNGDGKADLLWHDHATGQNVMWLMDGFNVIGGAYITPSTDPNFSIAASVDLDGDRKTDLLWHSNSSGQNVIWLMDGFNIKGRAVIDSVPNTFRLVGAGDFNGDGRTDVFWRVPSSGQDTMWLMNGFTVVSSASEPAVDTAYSMDSPRPIPH